AFKLNQEGCMMSKRSAFLAATLALVSVVIAWPHAEQTRAPVQGGGGPGGKGYTVPDTGKQMGWAVRDYLNSVSWPANKPLWNTAKQKLLDGKKINAWTTSS